MEGPKGGGQLQHLPPGHPPDAEPGYGGDGQHIHREADREKKEGDDIHLGQGEYTKTEEHSPQALNLTRHRKNEVKKALKAPEGLLLLRLLLFLLLACAASATAVTGHCALRSRPAFYKALYADLATSSA